MASLKLLPLLSLLLVNAATIWSQPNESSVLFDTLKAKCPGKLTEELEKKALRFAALGPVDQAILKDELTQALIKCVVEPAWKMNPLSTAKTPKITKATTAAISTADIVTPRATTELVTTSTAAKTTATSTAAKTTTASTAAPSTTTKAVTTSTTTKTVATSIAARPVTTSNDATTAAAVTTTATLTSTTDEVKSTKGPPTSESFCLTATNLTEEWRSDALGSGELVSGKHFKNRNACDFHKDLQWFRFTKPAGNRILDYAPEANSCGTLIAYWSNGTHPIENFKISTIKAFGTICKTPEQKCEKDVIDLEVIRCGDNNFIYRRTSDTSSDTCEKAFCGMS